MHANHARGHDHGRRAGGENRQTLSHVGLPARFHCPLCGCPSGRLHRVRAVTRGPWLLGCSPCSARLAQDSEGFAYGGRIMGRSPIRKPA